MSINLIVFLYIKGVYNVDVSESATTGHLVVTVAANDPDSGSDANGEVTFTFVSTYSDFVLDQSSGAVRSVIIDHLYVSYCNGT